MVMAKTYATDEERLAARRETVRRYNHSAKGKATEARRDPEKARAAWARYRETDKYAAAQERRRVKEQAAGWPKQLAHRRAVRAVSPERVQAWIAVRWALEFGLLVRPDACGRCGAERRLHAHHHNGYDRDHWIDVLWLCSPCHRTVHR
jgi:G3E family GTPase